jgi:hypothetical protein
MSRKGGGIFVKKHNSHRGVVMEVNESISNFFIIYKCDTIFRDREGTLYFVFCICVLYLSNYGCKIKYVRYKEWIVK